MAHSNIIYIRDKLLLAALETRLAEVERDLGGLECKEATSVSIYPAKSVDYEEVLRLLMVRYFPNVKRAGILGSVSTDILALLRELEQPATGSDLRFLDAFNNYFEVARTAEQEFLEIYRRVLRAKVDHLKLGIRC